MLAAEINEANEASVARKKAKGVFIIRDLAAVAAGDDQDGRDRYGGINRYDEHHDQGCLDIFI